MRRSGIDMWLIIAREYNEDPVILTLLPATWHAARRTTILVAYDPGEDKALKTSSISRYNTGELFATIWNRESQPDQCKAEDIKAAIYTHPLGYHGHAAGPTIGLWDQQNGVPGQGDYRFYANTAYAIELNASTLLEEWNKEIRIMLEEDAFFDGENVPYIDGGQTELMIIPRKHF